MITIRKVQITGTSERGDFSGELEFGPGLQILSAPNRYGKSLAFSAITWCLGVEQIFGAQAGDNAVFPAAARSHIDLGGERAIAVRSSLARVTLDRNDGRQLVLTRCIVGGQSAHIDYDDGETKGTLQTGYGTALDPTAGFQAHFRKWAGLPEMDVLNSRGQQYPIYLENLAPLFLIEQTRGWADIQAEQVYRYGLLEIADGAFEYLLGLKNRLEARLARQKAAFREQSLQEEARFIAEELAKVLAGEGWSPVLGGTGSVKAVRRRWADVDLHDLVKERYRFDYDHEAQRLSRELENLRSQLGTPRRSTDDSAAREVSQRVVAIKGKLHEIQGRISTLRAQLREQQSVLASVDARWSSAKDLLRLKREGVGVLPEAECPTCHQVVEPARLQLQEQPIESIEIHVQSLERQRSLLRRNVDLLEREMLAVTAEERKVDEDLQEAESALRLVNAAVGDEREVMVKFATDIIAIERDIDRNRALHDRIETIQEKVGDWVKRASEGAADETALQESPAELEAFEKVLRKNVVSLGVGGVTSGEVENLRLGPHYEPLLAGRGLPAYGSASDRARLVLAYTLALLTVGTQHPGFAVFDEPVQQNPDPNHRRMWLDFLRAGADDSRRQRVLFTSLRPEEIKALRDAKVVIQERGGRLLNLNG